MAGARDERVTDLFFTDSTPAGNPAEEGLVRRVNNDLVVFIDGVVKSLTATPPGGVPAHEASHRYDGSDPIGSLILLANGGAPVGKIAVTNASGHHDYQDAPGAGFGADVQIDEEEGTTTTTSGTYQNKLSYTTSVLTAGAYILLYQWVVTGSKNNTQVESRIQIDNTDVQEQLIKVSQANSQWSVGSHKVFPSLSGAYTFDIDWRKAGGSGNAGILWARIALWRLA